MALTPRLITSNTLLAAAALVLLLLGSFWLVVEYAPNRTLPDPGLLVLVADPSDYRQAEPTKLDVAFSPDQAPQDPSLCHWTAEQVFRHFEPLTSGDGVESHSRSIAGLVEAYIDLRCPNAIHQGNWHITAQILGVGIVYETLRPQAEIYDDTIEWNPRAQKLVDTAVSTFEVLAPQALCETALHQNGGGAENAFTPLVTRCLEAFK